MSNQNEKIVMGVKHNISVRMGQGCTGTLDGCPNCHPRFMPHNHKSNPPMDVPMEVENGPSDSEQIEELFSNLSLRDCCDACKSTQNLCIDYYKTGEIKGTLCRKCNTTAALLNDSADRAMALYLYLQKQNL